MNAPITPGGDCVHCGGTIVEADSVKLIDRTNNEIRHAHATCRQRHLARLKLDQEWRDRSRRESLVSSWKYSCINPLTTFPAWDFARVENREFIRRASKKLADGILGWRGLTSLFVSAKTGAGKTSLLVASLHDRYARYTAELDADPSIERRLQFAFVSGPSIAGCRRRAKIGDEAKLVELAIETPLLILDELGFEPISEELLFVVDERHKRGRTTVTTTGRTLESFVERYGGSVFRKLTEGGTTLEDWK